MSRVSEWRPKMLAMATWYAECASTRGSYQPTIERRFDRLVLRHHAPRKVSTGGWFTTERVASQPAKQTNKPPPTRP